MLGACHNTQAGAQPCPAEPAMLLLSGLQAIGGREVRPDGMWGSQRAVFSGHVRCMVHACTGAGKELTDIVHADRRPMAGGSGLDACACMPA